MLARKSYLVIAKPNSNLLVLLSEYEYKTEAIIDIVLTDVCSEKYRNTLINCLGYFSQLNYLRHKFRIFTFDKQLIKQIKENETSLDLKEKVEVYSAIRLLNMDLVDIKGNLINLYKYKHVLCVNDDKIEVYTDSTKVNLKVNIHGNDTI